MKSIGIVIVSYGHEKEVTRLVNSFLPQLAENDKVRIVDNKKPWRISSEDFADDRIKVIWHDNGGFAAGCNEGAKDLDADVYFFLNPDTLIVDPTLLDSMRAAAETDYAAWMPYLLLEDGTINSAGNALHISGLSWCNGLGQQPIPGEITDISIASGACLAVKREWWEKLGGMELPYFMYHEDTDFSARILLAGGRIGLYHNAFVQHDYDYGKGDYKWIYIERNRIVFALSTWPGSVLAVLAPQLLGVGLGLWLIAAKEKRLGLKWKSTKLLLKDARTIYKMRRRTQKLRSVSAAEFFKKMSWQLDNPNLGINNRIVDAVYVMYYRVALSLLGGGQS
ncbi:glycosyltransferase family 2 protein [Corynebacterium kutscheri]|uniref:Putative glycosyltransferase n=1 Tax=Corynebacterium kutscheri TaxID=35755 RepID=A0A0F6R0I9_9CORY|nr:glycosyltransferase family 2 protein [Corynebacterium kutscheri]AKE40448.1 putative glycosyltransferase [Corynebacterium kutscheri]VEH10841.1 predicted glycosyltransferase [Corynebacterium kutscheri]